MLGVKKSGFIQNRGGIHFLHIECIILSNLEYDNCIIIASYKILYDNCEGLGHKNWVYFVKKYLSELLFFENCDRQIIYRSSLFCIKQRMFDNFTQSLYADIENSKKCIFYKYLIDEFQIQHYI